MPTIFLFLKNFLFISDLLKTRYIQYLAKHYRVVVFSSAINEESVGKGQYFQSPNVEYLTWKVQNPRLFAVFKFLRMATLHELDRLPGMAIFYQSRSFRQDKRARLLRLISWPLAPLLTIDFFTKLETLLLRCSKAFTAYCKKYNPALVITATPGIQVFDAEAILLAKKMGIPSLATNFSWDNLTAFKAVRLRKPDYLFVWNEVIREAARHLHRFSTDRVFLTGSMRFDKYFDPSYPIPDRQEFLKSKNLNPKLKTILFSTVASGNCPYQTEVIGQILAARESGAIPRVNILIRLHPFDSADHYEKFRGVREVHIEKAGKEVPNQSGQARIEMNARDFINLKATLAYGDININYKSTISLESFIFDRPVINFINPTAPFQNRYYTEPGSYYYPLVKEGAVVVTANEKELVSAVNEYLAHPEKDSAHRQKIAREFFGFSDGLSYQRNVDLLANLISPIMRK